MTVWIVVFVTVVVLSQHECTNCDFTQYPREEYTMKSCRPHESQDSESCQVVPAMYVNDSDAGTVVVEFNVLSKSCNVSSYEFRFEVDERLNETNCKRKLFRGNGHLAEITVFIRYGETVESCGKTQIVTLEHVYQGCYRLGYIYKVDNKATQKLMIQYLKTAYKKEETPCDDTCITPNNIKRRISSRIRASIGGRGSSRGRLLGADAASASVIALDTSSTHVSISTPLSSFGVGGRLSSRQTWNLTQSVLLKSGTLRKDDRHLVSISTGDKNQHCAVSLVLYSAQCHQRHTEVQIQLQRITSLCRAKHEGTSAGWMALGDNKVRAVNILPLEINRRKYFLLNSSPCLLMLGSIAPTRMDLWNYGFVNAYVNR